VQTATDKAAPPLKSSPRAILGASRVGLGHEELDRWRPLSDRFRMLADLCRNAGTDGGASIPAVSPRWVAADKYGAYSGPFDCD
jgi:hypothetical protein